MDTILNFMDKIYGDSTALITLYVVGAILLLVFIVLLIISLKKPSKIEKKEKETKNEKINDTTVETVDKSIEEEKQTVEITDAVLKEEISNIPNVDNTNNQESVVSQALNNVDKVELTPSNEETAKEETVDESKLSAEIPNVDDYVDDVVKKTYEKNEQFSSVYVGNTTSIKLDKVMDDLNVDKDVKEALVENNKDDIQNNNSDANAEVGENVVVKDVEEIKIEPPITEENKEIVVSEESTSSLSSLDALKSKLEEKQKETVIKQDDLKEKLANLKKDDKKEEIINPEDLLKKLNAMKEK